MKKFLMLILLLGGLHWSANAETTVCDSVSIRFRVSKSNLDPDFMNNRQALDRIADSLKTGYNDSIYQLRRILITGGASPEGSVRVNRRLSEQRAATLFNYLSRYGELPESLTTTKYLGCDWEGLQQMVRTDANVPYREDVLALISDIIADIDADSPRADNAINRLKQLRGGMPYRYMLQNLFPDLRGSKIKLWYEKVKNPAVIVRTDTICTTDTIVMHDTIYQEVTVQLPCIPTPWYAALKTNMLYDAMLIPNIGVEVAFADWWSVTANWMYAWWSKNTSHRYWRTYGGNIEVRRWFGNAAAEKPLTGHHVGIYGQMLTYDIEFGGRGYQGGKWTWATGVSYGYSLPITRHLNIDFNIGIGYLQGTYHKYDPQDGHYVWKSTHKRHWFGPTNAEVSLVWLFGTGNVNKKKGGEQ